MIANRNSRQNRRRLILPVLALLLGLSFAGTARADGQALPVPGIQQEQSNWCWATTVQAVIKYFYGSAPSQCDIVAAGLGKTSGDCPDQTGSIANQLTAYKASNVTGTGVRRALTFDEVVTEITNKRPLNAGLYWNTGGGHDVVVVAYDKQSSGGQYVTYMDPDDGVQHKASYDWFKGGSSPTYDHVWGDAIYQLTAGATDNTTPAEALAAADRELGSFKAAAAAEPQAYGFTSADEVKRLRVGPGFRVHMVDANLLRNTTSGSLLALAKPVERWEFVLMLDGRFKTYLTIAHEGGSYRMVHAGGKAESLGQALTLIRGHISGHGGAGAPTLVKAGATYYLAARLGAGEVAVAAVPPERSDLAGGAHHDKVVPAADIVKHLSHVQQNSMPGQKRGGGPISLALAPAEGPQRKWPWILAASGAVVAVILVLRSARLRKRNRR